MECGEVGRNMSLGSPLLIRKLYHNNLSSFIADAASIPK